MQRRDFIQACSYFSVLYGLGNGGRGLAAIGKPTQKTIDAFIDARIADNVGPDDFAAVLQASPNISRRSPGIADMYRHALQDPNNLAFFNKRRVKALVRLKLADLDPVIKGAMLDLQLEKVDHSVAMCMDHFIGVYELLRKWGHADQVAFVGLFHAIYGTQYNVIDLLDYRSPADRQHVRGLVGELAERWLVLYGLMDDCPFVLDARSTMGSVNQLSFFENSGVLSQTISEADFHALAEVQVANAYEHFVATGDKTDIGIARKFTLLRPYLTSGAASAINDVLTVFPRNSDADIGCASPAAP